MRGVGKEGQDKGVYFYGIFSFIFILFKESEKNNIYLFIFSILF